MTGAVLGAGHILLVSAARKSQHTTIIILVHSHFFLIDSIQGNLHTVALLQRSFEQET